MLGTGSFGEICQAVEDVMHDGRPLYFGDKSGPVEEIGRVITTGPGWAYLRIAEGCDNWCAFCAIPAIPRPLPQPCARCHRAGSKGARSASASRS